MSSIMQGISSIVNEKWSKKYKRSIDCNHPKGFSQKAHCAGKRKHNESIEMEMVCEYCGMCKTHGNLNEIKKGQKDSNGYTKCWSGYHTQGTKKSSTTGKRVRNCVPNESVDEAANAAQQAAIAISMKKAGKKPKKEVKEGEVIKGPWSDKPKLRVVSNTPDINDIDQMTRGFMKSKLMPPSLDNRTNREILNKVIIYIFETFPDAYKTMTDNQTYAIAKKITDKVFQNSMNTRESSVIKGIVDEVSDTRTGTRKTGDLITGEHDSAYQRLKAMAPKLYDYIRNQAPVPVDPVMTLQFLQSMRGNQDAALARMKSELEKDTERMYGREYPVNEMPDSAGPVGTQPGGWRKMESSIMKGINGRK